MSSIDVFYTLPNTHLLKIMWFLIFVPAFVVVMVFALRKWRSNSWLPTGLLAGLLAAHIAYSTIAPALYFHGRWYAPRSADAPNFPDTQESTR